MPPIKNIDLKNIFTVRRIEDAIGIKKQMEKSQKVVIIGGGYIGIEMLEAVLYKWFKLSLDRG